MGERFRKHLVERFGGGGAGGAAFLEAWASTYGEDAGKVDGLTFSDLLRLCIRVDFPCLPLWIELSSDGVRFNMDRIDQESAEWVRKARSVRQARVAREEECQEQLRLQAALARNQMLQNLQSKILSQEGCLLEKALDAWSLEVRRLRRSRKRLHSVKEGEPSRLLPSVANSSGSTFHASEVVSRTAGVQRLGRLLKCRDTGQLYGPSVKPWVTDWRLDASPGFPPTPRLPALK